MGRSFLYIFFLAFLYSCSSEITDSSEREPENSDVFVSTYNPSSSGDVLIRGGKILTGTGEELEGVDILIRDNMIQEISKAINPSSDALVIDAEGKWITPGIIDIHSHNGCIPST
jgi:Dihydroorotase and related cyclic amidohydrolases